MLQHSSNNYSEQDQPAPATQEDNGHDILRVLWRWKGLPILGSIIGLVAGYFYFLKLPPTYVSSALVQVVYPSAESPGLDSLESPDGIRGKTRLDESMIIRSDRVIDLAIEHSDLKSQAKLKDMSDPQIRAWIAGHLTVQPAGRDASTALMEIRFECQDQELCQAVIDSVIAGYDQYLSEAYRNLGSEVVKVVTQAQDTLRKNYEDLSKKNSEFRMKAPLVWLGEEGTNHFAENCLQIKKAINEIDIESERIDGTLRHITQVEKLGRSADAILIMLAADGTMQGIPGLELLENKDKEKDQKAPLTQTKPALPYTSQERRAELVEMQMKMQELLDTVGEGHPAVATMRRKIELLNQHVASMANAERTLQSEMNKHTVSPEKMTPQQRLNLWKSTLEERFASLQRQKDGLQKLANDNEQKSKELGEYLSQNRLLKSELESVQGLLDGYTNTLNRIQILPQENRRTLETLTPPGVGGFAGPTLTPYLVGGSAMGFILMAGLALLLDFADKSFRSPDEIARSLGIPILGHIPSMSLSRGDKKYPQFDPALCTATGTSAAGAEAFRSVRTGLYFTESSAGHRVIQVTSPVPGDGKSTVAANLAIAIAQSGRSVLLVDADMRRPRIGKLLGISTQIGLADVIQGSSELDAVTNQTPIANLSVIACGHQAANPSELLSHSGFAKFVSAVREKYEFVIIDTPPVLAVSDPCSVACRADGVLLTVRLRRNAKPLATQAVRALEAVGARPLGVIVNGVANNVSYEYRYADYGYGSYASNPAA